MSSVCGLMLNTIQYTYGVIGAEESSTTKAMLLVPGGAPAQDSGGVLGLSAPQVKVTGKTPSTNAPLLMVITSGGAIAPPDPSSPHPDASSVQHPAVVAAASRRAARRPRASFTPHPRCRSHSSARLPCLPCAGPP